MASQSGRTKIRGRYCSGRSFFRIILPYNLKEGKLRLPEKFVCRYGKCLSNPVVLRLPNGTMWTVKTKTCNDAIWLKEGWREFAEYLSLDVGHFLLFKYEENSHFHVMVYDKSTTEVDYSSNFGSNGKTANLSRELEYQNTDIDERDTDSVVFLGEECASSPKENQGEQEGTPPNFLSNQTMESKRHKKLKCLTQRKKERLVERAGKAFKTKHPYFMLPVQPSHVSKKFQAHIPWKSVEGHVDFLHNRRDITLEIPDGRASWPVKCYIWKSYATKPNLAIRWKEFAVDNHLEVGDVCIFVLVERRNRKYQVIIKRASHDDANCSMSPAYSSEVEDHPRSHKRSLDFDSDQFNKKCFRGDLVASRNAYSPSKRIEVKKTEAILEEDLKSVSSETSRYITRSHSFVRESFAALVAAQKFMLKIEHPYFMVLMQPTHLINSLTLSIPSDFVNTNVKQNVRLEVGKKSWNLRLVNVRKSVFKFSEGWHAFVKDNNLQVGYICVFVLMDGRERRLKLKVAIFKRTVQMLAA